MNLSRSTQAVGRSQSSSHWSLWLLLTGLLAFGGFIALPSLQAALPQAEAGPTDRLLADGWQQQRWLVASRVLLKQQAADKPSAEHAPSPSDAAWLAAATVLPILFSAVRIASFTATHRPALPLSTLSGSPRGPPSALL